MVALTKLIATLLLPAGAVVLRGKPLQAKMGLMPMQMFRADCSVVSNKRAKVPGAGVGTIEPFKTVLKDGFYGVDCVDDYMFTYGDKFGGNKFNYKLGETANVSIVHYDQYVTKEDRSPMTPQLCFSFCRTIPDMSFFGIRNGDKCYCTPYFESIEGDDTMCDVVCEGDGTAMCGSKTKSSIFGMHTCSNSATDLSDSSGKMEQVNGELVTNHGKVVSVKDAMQGAADALQPKFGAAGDPVASDLLQTAKVEAGVLDKMATEAKAITDEMATKKTEADGMKTADFTSSEVLTNAEDLMSQMDELSAKGEAALAELERAARDTAPDPATAVNASKQYYPITYFIDKKLDKNPSTCGGTSAHAPLMAPNVDTCAQACDREVHSCVGFSFFTSGSDGLCFLISKFKSGVSYKDCPDSSPEVKCMAKLSKFEGTTLDPKANGDGKCENCLKEFTVADRCWSAPGGQQPVP